MTHSLSNPLHPEPFAPAGVAGITPPMVGRDDALQRLLQQLYGVIEGGAARLVTVVGPPGIGKSRLAYEFCRVAGRLPEPVPIFTLQADRQSAARPYSLFRLLVAALFQLPERTPPAAARQRIEAGVARLLGPDSQDRAHFIGQLAGYDFGDSPHLRGVLAEPRQLRDRAIHYAAQCLAAFTASTPLLLVIDDLHNADDGSLDAIAQLMQTGEPLSLLLLCLTQLRLYERRPDWDQQAGEPSTRIDLLPLDERASRRLVAEVLRKAGKLPVDLRSMLVSKSEGNPFYIEELIKMLISDGVIVPGATVWSIRQGRMAHLRIPATLAEVLRARLQSLTAAERDFLIRAAVVGRFFWPAAALQLGGPGGVPLPPASVAELLRSLEHQELVAPSPDSPFPAYPAFAFRHELLHEVTYSLVPPELRAEQHCRVAEWLIANSGERSAAYASLIADHFRRGDASGQAAVWYLRAGTYARETFAIDAAQASYRAALDLLPATPEFAAQRVACYEGLGTVQLWAARLGEAIASYQQMAEQATAAGDHVAAARAWNGLAYVQDHNLEYLASRESALRGIAIAEPAGATNELILGLFHLAWSEVRLNNLDVALSLGQRAAALLAGADLPTTAARWSGLLGVIYDLLGDYERALHYQHEALAYYRGVGNLMEAATQLNNLGNTAHLHGEFETSLSYLREAERVSHELGSRVTDIYIYGNLAAALNGLGQHQTAEESARRGLALCELSRISPFADFFCALAEARLGQHDPTEAMEAAQRALELARVNEGPREVATAWRVLGRAISATSAPLGAPPCFEESARLFAESGAHGERARTLRAWAEHEQRHGHPRRSDDLLREARALFAQAGMDQELARTPEPQE